MRTKEDAHDYRYFPEPDLMPIITSDETLEQWKSELPIMPDIRMAKYIDDYKIAPTEAKLLVASRLIADFFEEGAAASKNPKSVGNWIITEIFSRLSEDEKEQGPLPITGDMVGALVNLIEDGVISSKIAKEVFAKMWETGKKPSVIVEEDGLKQNSNTDELRTMAEEVIANNPKPVQDYLGGKDAAIQALMGQMMKATRGKANPKMVIDLLKSILDEMK